ncbi:uncharacterized protein LOC133138737 isoform X1 [Conger conger]|nr:uncharacterized protein LOC133138737 isoform X1 [Conger conger]
MSEKFVEVDRLRAQLQNNRSGELFQQETEITSQDVLSRIEKVILEIITSLTKEEAPMLVFQNRSSWANIRFDSAVGLHMGPDSNTVNTIRSDCSASVNRFALTLKVLSAVYKLVQSNTYATKRDIYYNDTQLFGTQRTVDSIVDDISCMLKAPRRSLHVLATSKGFLSGDLSYMEEDGTKVNCSSRVTAMSVSSNVCGIKNISSQAKFVLIVEKDATFQRLLDDGFCSRLAPCIIITGKGVPDVNSRLMVKKLWDTLHVPIFALVDADPHGIEIMCIYKYGSVSMSFEAQNLTVPSVMWLGLLPSDIERLRVPKDVLIPFTKKDESKLTSLLKRPYIVYQPAWEKEMEMMLKLRQKAEIQSLTSLAPDFLTSVYLPNKLRSTMSLFGASSGFGAGGSSVFGSATTDSHNPMKDVEVTSPPDDSISCLAFSPPAMPGNFLIGGSWANDVRCWEVQDNGQTVPKAQQMHTGPVLDVCWSDDGSKVFTASCDKTAKMWDLNSNQTMQIAQHEAPIRTVHWIKAPNYSCVMTGSWDKTLKFWDTRSPSPMMFLQLPERCYCADVVYPMAVVASAERGLIVYQLENQPSEFRRIDSPLKHQHRCVAIFKDKQNKPTGFALGSIEGRVAIHYINPPNPAKDNFTFKCHRSNGTNTATPQDIYAVNAISFHPVHGTLATVGSDGRFSFWDKDARTKLKTSEQLDQPITACCFNNNGNIFAYASSYDWSKGHEYYNPQKKNYIFLRNAAEELKPRNKKW